MTDEGRTGIPTQYALNIVKYLLQASSYFVIRLDFFGFSNTFARWNWKQ